MVLALMLAIASLAYATWYVFRLARKFRTGEYILRGEEFAPVMLVIVSIASASTFARQLMAHRKREHSRTPEM
jgi:hypothetical protein